MCPDWELNQQPFGSQACTQSTEPLRVLRTLIFYLMILVIIADKGKNLQLELLLADPYWPKTFSTEKKVASIMKNASERGRV